MAYRRRHGITKSSTFKEEIYHPPDNNNINSNGENIIKASLPTLKTSYSFSPSSATQSLEAQVSPASAAHRDSSPSSAHPLFPSETQEPKVPFSFFTINLRICFCFFLFKCIIHTYIHTYICKNQLHALEFSWLVLFCMLILPPWCFWLMQNSCCKFICTTK